MNAHHESLLEARIKSLEAALERLRPIIQNSKDAFQNPPVYNDPGLRGWRFEGLASGCRIGLEVIDKALVPMTDEPLDPAPISVCPKCGALVEDLDGFGVLAHDECGYCSHFDVYGNACRVCGATQFPRDLLVAERQFLIASTIVWHEIDRLTRQHGRYPGLPQDTDPRVHEKATWETYRDLMDRHDLMVCPRCEGQGYDIGSCHLCENTGYTRLGNS